jgi:hypothetical protein
VVLRPTKFGNPEKKCENCTRAGKKELLYHEIEPNPSKDRAMHEGNDPSC